MKIRNKKIRFMCLYAGQIRDRIGLQIVEGNISSLTVAGGASLAAFHL